MLKVEFEQKFRNDNIDQTAKAVIVAGELHVSEVEYMPLPEAEVFLRNMLTMVRACQDADNPSERRPRI